MIVLFYEIVTKYEPELKTQLVLLDISTNITSDRGVLSLQILSNDLSIYDVYHVFPLARKLFLVKD